MKLQPTTNNAAVDASAMPVAAAEPGATTAATPQSNDLASLASFLDQLLQQQAQPEAAPQPADTPLLPGLADASTTDAAATAATDAQDKPAAADATPELPALPAALTTPDALPQALAMALQQMQARPAPTPPAAQQSQQQQAASAPLLQAVSADIAPVASQQDLTPQPAAVAARPADAPAAKDSAPEVEPAVPFAAQLAAAPLDAKTSAAPAPAVLHLPTTQSPQQWQSPLLQALGDRIQLQIAARSEQATIRLEPPQLGRVDIEIRQALGGAGPLQVRLEATHVEVVQQLQQISDGLRWNLAQQRQGGDVVVQVASSASANANAQAHADARQGQQGRQPDQQQQQARRPGRALDEGADTAAAFALN